MNPSKRIESVDVYRGFVMFLMMAEVWHLGKVADALPDSSFWRFLAYHQDHVAWAGASLHDFIQPSFSFLVGVALPFSMARRLKEDKPLFCWPILRRSLVLILLGVFLRSMWHSQTYWTFEDTLSQIGLGYPFLVLFSFLDTKKMLLGLLIILVAYWLAFILYPLPNAHFDYNLAGVSANWEHNYTGLAAHFNKNTNLAWAFDRWWLNLFPRENVFLNNSGGYATLSFIPTLCTMMLGLWAGQLIYQKNAALVLIKKFLTYAIALILAGLLIHLLGICPIVKRIWTPSWVLFSGGVCFLFLAAFTYIIDLKNGQKYFNILKTIGMNSIAAYVAAHTIDAFIKNSLSIHFGANYAKLFGLPYETLVSGTLILFFEIWLLRWMYKRGIFIKI